MCHALQVSALFPVFAVLERQTEGAYEGAIELKLAPLVLSVTESRLARLRGFVLGLMAALSIPEGGNVLLDTLSAHAPGSRQHFHNAQVVMYDVTLVHAGQALSSRNASKATDSLPEEGRSLSMFSQRRGTPKWASLAVTAADT